MKWELAEETAVAGVADVTHGRAPTDDSRDPSSTADSSRRDLDLVEQLLERCWQQIDSSELNVKLADLVRLLEFKEKLRPAVAAEKTFWTMIEQMRHEELARFGESAPDTGTTHEVSDDDDKNA
jgi:hypothetical protein